MAGNEGRPKEFLHLQGDELIRIRVAAVLDHRDDLWRQVLTARRHHDRRRAHRDAVQDNLCLRIFLRDSPRPEHDVLALAVAERQVAAAAEPRRSEVRRQHVIAHREIILGDVIGILLRAAVAVHDDDPPVRLTLRLEMRRREVNAVLRVDVPVLRGVVRLVKLPRLRRHQERIGPWRLLRFSAVPRSRPKCTQ